MTSDFGYKFGYKIEYRERKDDTPVSLEYKDSYGSIRIEGTPEDYGDTIYEFAEKFLKPLLHARGFHSKNIKELFGEE